jgi:DNA-binding transcriptional LysR family regulator
VWPAVFGARSSAELPEVVAAFHAVNEGLDLARTRRAEHAFGRGTESRTHIRSACVDDVFQTDAVRGTAGFAHFHIAALLSWIRLGHGVVYLQRHDADQPLQYRVPQPREVLLGDTAFDQRCGALYWMLIFACRTCANGPA